MIDILYPEILRDEKKKEIYGRILLSHYTASIYNKKNGSRVAFQIALGGSNNIVASICAGLLSTGYRHAPIIAARDFIFHSNENVERGRIYPGYGHSVYKDGIDPSFIEVAQKIEEYYPSIWEMVVRRNNEINEMNGIHIFPNAAAITAAAAEILEIPAPMELMLFIIPRATEWVASVSDRE